MDIRLAQKHAWQNKLAKGFNTTDVPLEFCLLNSEVAEAFDAWRRGRPDVAEELADIAIFLFGLAEMVGADLQEAVEAKLAVNEARVYRRLPNGVLVKDAAAPAPQALHGDADARCGGVAGPGPATTGPGWVSARRYGCSCDAAERCGPSDYQAPVALWEVRCSEPSAARPELRS